MNTVKVRKNFVFSKETTDKLEALKIANNQSATKIVQGLIDESYKIIKRQERDKAIDEYLELSREIADGLVEKFGDKYKGMTIQSLKVEMGEECMKRCL